MRKLLIALLLAAPVAASADIVASMPGSPWVVTLQNKPCGLMGLIPPQYLGITDWQGGFVTNRETGQKLELCWTAQMDNLLWGEEQNVYFMFDETYDNGFMSPDQFKPVKE